MLIGELDVLIVLNEPKQTSVKESLKCKNHAPSLQKRNPGTQTLEEARTRNRLIIILPTFLSHLFALHV